MSKEVDKTLSNQTFYAKLKGISKATVIQQIGNGKVESVEVLGGTRLVKLSESEMKEIERLTPETIEKIVRTPKRVRSLEEKLKRLELGVKSEQKNA